MKGFRSMVGQVYSLGSRVQGHAQANVTTSPATHYIASQASSDRQVSNWVEGLGSKVNRHSGPHRRNFWTNQAKFID